MQSNSHSTTTLPEGYEEIYSVDLRQNKKLFIAINLSAVIIVVIMIVIGSLAVSVTEMFSFENGMLAYFLRFGVLIVGSVLYIVIHELTHAAVMKIYGAKKIRFGASLSYAYAGSENDFFDKRAYIRIALAPLVVLGIALAVINLLVPSEWFWVVYIIQICNVAGAVGDLFVTFRFSKMPKDILVKDTGVSMTVYSAEK